MQFRENWPDCPLCWALGLWFLFIRKVKLGSREYSWSYMSVIQVMWTSRQRAYGRSELHYGPRLFPLPCDTECEQWKDKKSNSTFPIPVAQLLLDLLSRKHPLHFCPEHALSLTRTDDRASIFCSPQNLSQHLAWRHSRCLVLFLVPPEGIQISAHPRKPTPLSRQGHQRNRWHVLGGNEGTPVGQENDWSVTSLITKVDRLVGAPRSCPRGWRPPGATEGPTKSLPKILFHSQSPCLLPMYPGVETSPLGYSLDAVFPRNVPCVLHFFSPNYMSGLMMAQIVALFRRADSSKVVGLFPCGVNKRKPSRKVQNTSRHQDGSHSDGLTFR